MHDSVTAMPKAVLALSALGVVVVFLGLKKVFFGRRRGSVDRLVSRGMLDEDRENESDPYYNNMMKNINTVQVETLSREQIERARARRAGDLRKKREGGEADRLEDFAIPENHPWAEKTEVGDGDEELIKARLAVSRGLPLETLEDRQQDNS